jgi:SpoVK/Ycf46/Vps4 family AAA+-type ATPase
LVGADIASICQKASLLAIREFLESKEEDLERLTIGRKHFMEALKGATTHHLLDVANISNINSASMSS